MCWDTGGLEAPWDGRGRSLLPFQPTVSTAMRLCLSPTSIHKNSSAFLESEGWSPKPLSQIPPIPSACSL